MGQEILMSRSIGDIPDPLECQSWRSLMFCMNPSPDETKRLRHISKPDHFLCASTVAFITLSLPVTQRFPHPHKSHAFFTARLNLGEPSCSQRWEKVREGFEPGTLCL